MINLKQIIGVYNRTSSSLRATNLNSKATEVFSLSGVISFKEYVEACKNSNTLKNLENNLHSITDI